MATFLLIIQAFFGRRAVLGASRIQALSIALAVA